MISHIETLFVVMKLKNSTGRGKTVTSRYTRNLKDGWKNNHDRFEFTLKAFSLPNDRNIIHNRTPNDADLSDGGT